jgi:FkbM family methyltransferase
MESYSQIGQDLFVLDYFNNVKGGYFVEVGALNGIVLSNTYLLEKNFDWKGVCIEPSPDHYNKLVANRKCVCSDKAAYSESGLTLEFVKKYDGLLSGLKDHYDFGFFSESPVEKIIAVKTSTLTDILDENDAPKYIHYLSLDTEGSEVEILKGIDFGKYTFGIISIEHCHRIQSRIDQRAILEKNGYVFLKQNDFDDYYVYPKPNN